MLTVACVYKPSTTSEYTDKYVHRLYEGVSKYLSAPFKFVCYTNVRLPFETRALAPGLDGWFSKASLWLTPSDGDILYFDLDTVILGSLDQIAAVRQFTMLNDLGQSLSVRRLQSGVMYFTPESRADIRSVYDPQEFKRYGGDGQWLHHAVGAKAARWQDLVPGQFCSYKFDCCQRWHGKIPPEVRVVCFHGKPRPADVAWDPRRIWQGQFHVINAADGRRHRG